jgi:hypothetical protein
MKTKYNYIGGKYGRSTPETVERIESDTAQVLHRRRVRALSAEGPKGRDTQDSRSPQQGTAGRLPQKRAIKTIGKKEGMSAVKKISMQVSPKLKEIWRKKYRLKRYLELLQKQKTSEALHKEMLDRE